MIGTPYCSGCVCVKHLSLGHAESNSGKGVNVCIPATCRHESRVVSVQSNDFSTQCQSFS